jgi:hypothetical protein
MQQHMRACAHAIVLCVSSRHACRRRLQLKLQRLLASAAVMCTWVRG